METLSGKKIIKDQSLLRHEDIKNRLLILPELQAFIPPLLPDEFTQLESNIRKDGCREALLVWETTNGAVTGSEDPAPIYVLIDGHNRYTICQKWGLDFRINLVEEFRTMAEVRGFMIDNQLGRRNLTPEQMAYLRGLRYLTERSERGKYDRSEHKGQNVPYDSETDIESAEMPSAALSPAKGSSTSARLAKQFNVNEKTIKRDAEFAVGIEKLSPDLKADVLSGQTRINKAAIQQLAKSDVPNGSLSSIQSLAAYSSSTPATNTPTAKSGKTSKTNTLRDKLKTLIDQLVSSPADATNVCDAIIDCATQLKQAVLTETKLKERKNH